MYIYVSWAFKLRGSVDASVPMHSRYVGDRAEERIFERDPLNKQGLVTDRISIIFNSDFLARRLRERRGTSGSPVISRLIVRYNNGPGKCPRRTIMAC